MSGNGPVREIVIWDIGIRENVHSGKWHSGNGPTRIPNNQFDKIKEINKGGFATVYSAIWKDGPLHYQYNRYTRDSNKEVALKCLYNSQESIDSLINEVYIKFFKYLNTFFN